MELFKNSGYADSVWVNAHIYTMDGICSSATALACRGDTLLYVGDTDQAYRLIGPDTKVWDLNNRVIVPGFIEGHMHLQMYGESLQMLPIRDKSKADILASVKEAVRSLKPGQWLTGGMGWNNEVWENPSYPTKEELDDVSPDNPVLLPRMDGHLIWVNSKAFEACGIHDDTPNPPGGEYLRTSDGKLAGCAGNSAADTIRCHIPAPDSSARKKALLAAQEQLLKYGVTSINDMSTNYDNILDLKELYADQSFKLRFAGALRDVLTPDADPRLKDYFARCPEIDLFDKHYTIRAIKILGDGSVGAQSAALYEDYADRPGHRGILMQTDEELYRMIRLANDHNMQVITHAIGDAAIDQILTAYSRVLKETPTPDHRYRIEHFQLVTGDSCERAKRMGVLASMQPTHAPNSASMALRRLGPDRASRAYAVGMVLDVLGQIAGGSDAPVAPPDPLDGIHSAVTRTNGSNQPDGGFFIENAISRMQALQAYTCWGAYAQLTDHQKGSLEIGKLADFVVLDHDPLTVSNDELLNIQVCCTVIGGKVEYQNFT